MVVKTALISYDQPYALRSHRYFLPTMRMLFERDLKNRVIRYMPTMNDFDDMGDHGVVMFMLSSGDYGQKFTICALSYGGFAGYGVTACSPMDTWNDYTAQTIAFARAVRNFEKKHPTLFRDRSDELDSDY